MATSYKTPGVYVEEISKLPPSVAQVETAIPAFIGYTENDTYNGLSLVNKPTRIKSLKEYEEIFGMPQATTMTLNIVNSDGQSALGSDVTVPALSFRMYYSLQVYFANGGGPCYINCIAKYTNIAGNSAQKYTQLSNGLAAVKKEDEPTILIFPDALVLDSGDFHTLFQDALKQCGELMDRVVLIDVLAPNGNDTFASQASTFRTGVGNNFLSYGAAYYPYLRTNLLPYINEATHAVTGFGIAAGTMLRLDETTPGVDLTKSLYHANSKLYFDIKKSLSKIQIILPPSSAIAGVYCQVDSTRGVWKAPANVSLSLIKEPMVRIDDEDQKDMNVTGTGKSVNAIRTFAGKGIIVWGARTLAGNDNEWRYISVRRFYNMVEESVKKASEPFVFEPNDANTWAKVKGMIENFLTLQWRAGALMGAKADDAFFVHVGLGETMTALDIFEGRMIVEIGMAAVRPAEFIILRFSHKMLESA
ncbi:phage tail protein [Chitinophaga caeni]|uniref:Phage tail protein n=1 Tax=Chitinophaga caeni TaxID=2029983 RepID=A0A291QWX3_9BACT|nr:phage tail sheath C-terminal domain-containing protein [Chitinophaga caeni]ATL48382.1 phage tail protein [Chitinophaga caeni]